MTTSTRAGTGPYLLLVFALSGFAGLVYESIWTQYLGLFLGHAAYAQSFVLVLFMGGMAFGAWQVSRRSERLARPLAAYAAIELLIGLLGVGFDPIYHALTGLAYSHLFPAVGAGFALDAARYAIATLLIGAQCVLLGATFPLMSAAYLRLAPSSGGRVLAGLYFSNSLGAAIGAIVATFALLPAVGLPGTVMTGGLLSVLVALLVWPLARTPAAAQRPAMPSTASVAAPLVLVAAAITGATSFVYEVTWIRMLVQALGSTLHAFELMLAAFIGGIAFGGLWLRQRADRVSDALAAAGWAQVLMGLAALVSLFVYLHAFDWVGALRAMLTRTASAYVLYNVATAAISIVVMFPAAFFAGMTLPLLSLAWLRRGGGEAAIGRVYAANTIGAIAGVLLAMHVLMPAVGVRVALWLAASADLVLGVVLLGRAARAMPGRRLALVTAASLGAAVVAIAFTRVDPLVLASSVYRSNRTSLAEGTQMLFYADGKTASIAQFAAPGDAHVRSIATNGKVDAAMADDLRFPPQPDEYTMMLAAALPLVLHPAPKDVAVIGFGSGLTTHTFLGSERVARVDTIEIEPMMVQAARHFGARVERAYTDPRAHLVLDDAKAYLSGVPNRYDVIVSEPSNPWVAGVATLFSDEFYSFVPQHLANDGLFVQWLQTYEIDPPLVASVLKAMLPHFADVAAYASNEGDLLLVASPRERLPRLREAGAFTPPLRDEFARLSVHSTADLDRFFLMDRHGLEALARMYVTPANSDLFPVLQVRAPQTRFSGADARAIIKLAQSPWPLLEVFGGREPARAPSVAVDGGDGLAAARTAFALRDAMRGGTAPAAVLPPALRHALMRVRGDLPLCSDVDVGDWLDASSALAAATIPYLDAAELDGAWIGARWPKPCPADSPRALRALTFHAAVAARRWPDVARLGEAILADGSEGPASEFVAWVLGATELAHAAQGDLTALAECDRRYGNRVAGREAFALRWLQAAALVAHDQARAAR